jgi:hypothetical protein
MLEAAAAALEELNGFEAPPAPSRKLGSAAKVARKSTP